MRGDGILRRRRRDGSIGYQIRVGDERTAQTYDTLKEARAAKARDALRTRRYNVETCGSFAARWLKDYPRKKASTMDVYRLCLRHFEAEFRGKRLDDVDRLTARQFALRHRRSATVVRAMFNDALDEGLIDANPFAGLRLEQSRGRRDHEVLSVEELDALAQAALEAHGPEYGPVLRAMILFSGYVGTRLGESLALEWRDVDLVSSEVHVRRSLSRLGEIDTPKTQSSIRRVLVPEEARDAIQRMPRRLEHERLFLSRRFKPFRHFTAHHRLWDKVRIEAGRPDFAWHELRHFTAHHFFVTLGYPAELAAYQLGHDDGGQLIRSTYGHPNQGALERLKNWEYKAEIVSIQERREQHG